MLDSKVVDAKSGTWLELNVLPALQHWVRRPSNNFGFFIAVETLAGKRRTFPAEHFIRMRNCSQKGALVK